MGTTINYRPQGATLKRFHEAAGTFHRVLIGPLGSGKTQACIVELLHCIDNQEPDRNRRRRSRWVVARNTYRDLATTTIKDWLAIAGDAGDFSNGNPPTWTCSYRKSDGTTVEGEVLFEAFDYGTDDKKARGKQLTGVWCNELKELHKANVDMLASRIGRYPPRAEVPDAKFHFIADSNAPDRDHWLARLALEEKPDNWWFGIQPGGVEMRGGQWVKNPLAENTHNLPDNYYLNLISGKKDSWIRKNLANQFVFHADGMPVHPSFSEQLHVSAVEPTPGTTIHIGVDFGRTPAATFCQRQHDGGWFVFDELVTTNTSAHTFGQLLKHHINEHYSTFTVQITVDPAGSAQSQTRDETCIEMLQLAGLEAEPAPTNDFEERITALDSLLDKMSSGRPALQVNPRCSTLIRGLAGGYQFKRVLVAGADRYHNVPDKGPESHVAESLHYALLGAGQGTLLFDARWDSELADQSWTMKREYFE